MVTVERENGRVLIRFSQRDRISYPTYRRLTVNRFHNSFSDKYWEWKGPDTDRAEEAAKEIAACYNSKQLLKARTHG